jgi:hypothetical protein
MDAFGGCRLSQLMRTRAKHCGSSQTPSCTLSVAILRHREILADLRATHIMPTTNRSPFELLDCWIESDPFHSNTTP